MAKDRRGGQGAGGSKMTEAERRARLQRFLELNSYQNEEGDEVVETRGEPKKVSYEDLNYITEHETSSLRNLLINEYTNLRNATFEFYPSDRGVIRADVRQDGNRYDFELTPTGNPAVSTFYSYDWKVKATGGKSAREYRAEGYNTSKVSDVMRRRSR